MESKEQIPEYVQTFDQLRELGSFEFAKGTQVSFQPHGRYEEGRQVGTVKLWEEDPNIITIKFMGSKMGISCPDGEHITRENFPQRKDTWQIRRVD